jgi:general stress protein 26
MAFRKIVAAASVLGIGGVSWAAAKKNRDSSIEENGDHGDRDPVSFALRAARSLISNARFAVFVTIDQKGFPYARVIDPLSPNSSIDDIWFGTNRFTRKFAHISQNPRTALIYFDLSSLGFTYMSGLCSVHEDKQLKDEKFTSEWWLFYPEGPLGPRFVLVRFVPERLEVVSPLHRLAAGLNSWHPIVLVRNSETLGKWALEASPPDDLIRKLRNGLNEDGK